MDEVAVARTAEVALTKVAIAGSPMAYEETLTASVVCLATAVS